MEKYPHLVSFLTFYQQQRNSPKSTLDAYENAVKKFYNFLIENYGFHDPKRVEKTHFYKFKDYLVNASYARNTMLQWMSGVKSYFAYLDEMGLIQGSKFPAMSVAGGVAKIPHYVPTVAEIFKIRFKRRVRLRWATCFELVMSTGMRSDEMRALRACDFQFDRRPIDIETGQPSLYYTGTIQLQPRKHRGKTLSSRQLYFSALADKLLRRYFRFYKLDPMSHAPFHPWARQNFQDWVRDLGEGIVAPFDSKEEAEAGRVLQRDFSYRDVDVDNIDIDPRMKELIKSRQRTADEQPDYNQAGMKGERRRRRNLHPHSLRHFWTCATHYRNAFGERRSEDRLRIMAGHSYDQTTLTYLRNLDLVQTDDVWKRLWLGKATDWMGIDDD